MSHSERPRIIVVSPYWPWREPTGAPLRVRWLCEGLARVGEVDFLAVSDVDDPAEGWHENEHVSRMFPAPFPGPQTRVRRLLSLAVGADRARFALARLRCRPVARALASEGRYDLAVFVRDFSWLACGSLFSCPSIVDVDDHTDVVLRRWLALGKDDSGQKLDQLGRRKMVARIALAAARRRKVAKSRAWSIVTSRADQARAPVSRSIVIPNAYPGGTQITTQALEDRPRQLLFIGMQRYAPNADAADWLARQILPKIAKEMPDVQFRIVGKNDARVMALNSLPNVTVVGPVQDLALELAEARAVVVPMRVGGGSRIKILEAMAAGVPVVSTTIGAEGLDFKAGTHYLRADGAEDFAAAALAALQAGEPIRLMAQRAQERCRNEFSSGHVAQLVADAAIRAMST